MNEIGASAQPLNGLEVHGVLGVIGSAGWAIQCERRRSGHTTPPPPPQRNDGGAGAWKSDTRLKVLITNPVRGPQPVERPPLSKTSPWLPSPCEIAQSPCLPGAATHLPIWDQPEELPNHRPCPAPVASLPFPSNPAHPLH